MGRIANDRSYRNERKGFFKRIGEMLSRDQEERVQYEKNMADIRRCSEMANERRLKQEEAERREKENAKRLEEEAKRLKKEAKERIDGIVASMSSNQDTIKKYQNSLPSPDDNRSVLEISIQKECEEFMEKEIGKVMRTSLKRGKSYFLVASAKKYKVTYAVNILKSIGYMVINDTKKSTWFVCTYDSNGEEKTRKEKEGYVAEMQLF